MRRKTLTLMLVLLATFALVGVGFASWVITINANKELGETEQPQITSYGVTDNRLSAELKWDGNATPQFIFGKPSNYSTASVKWLDAQSDVLTESLTAKLLITITAADTGAKLSASNVDLTAVFSLVDTTTDNTGLQKYIAATTTNNYIEGPILDDKNKCNLEVNVTSSQKTEELSNKLTAEVTITFSWGTAFGNAGKLNPFTYFNTKPATDPIADGSSTTYADAAKQMLTDVFDLNGLKFNVTVSASMK